MVYQTLHTTEQSKIPLAPFIKGEGGQKNINIFLSVIDNLGDIGFACELIRSFHESSPGKYFFDIWTDEVEKVTSFFEKNEEIHGTFSINSLGQISRKEGILSFLLFHHPIPDDYPYSENELFLRIDYLSFDKNWIKYHGSEHIDSREGRKVIEIIPSPLPDSGGIIHPSRRFTPKEKLGKRFGIDPEKRWITIFSYKKTLEDILEVDLLKNTQFLLLGADSTTSAIASAGYDSSITLLPFLSLAEFGSLIYESEWAIIRGEVSFISTLQIGTPFFWDMYKQIGGLNTLQAEEFLDWIDRDEIYRDIFIRLNGQKSGTVKLSEIDAYFQNNPMRKKHEYKNLREELQKYIDKYHFSL